MNVGDKVRKVSGYPFPGHIVAAFDMPAGRRYVVNNSDAPGMLHIFNGGQLELVEEDNGQTT